MEGTNAENEGKKRSRGSGVRKGRRTERPRTHDDHDEETPTLHQPDVTFETSTEETATESVDLSDDSHDAAMCLIDLVRDALAGMDQPLRSQVMMELVRMCLMKRML